MKKISAILSSLVFALAVPTAVSANDDKPIHEVGGVNHDGLVDSLDASMILVHNAEQAGETA